jgi:hypothetical protein
MMGFGMSVAGVALADGQTEVREAIDRVRTSIERLRTTFDDSRPRLNAYNGTLTSETPAQLREFLSSTAGFEEGLADLADTIGHGMTPAFQARVNLVSDGTIFCEILSIIKDIRTDYIPVVRRVRLVTIKGIYRRAHESGVPNAELPKNFDEDFMAFAPSETNAWNETAYLMCDLDYLRDLIVSGQSEAIDRIDNYAEIVGSSHRPS